MLPGFAHQRQGTGPSLCQLAHNKHLCPECSMTSLCEGAIKGTVLPVTVIQCPQHAASHLPWELNSWAGLCPPRRFSIVHLCEDHPPWCWMRTALRRGVNSAQCHEGECSRLSLLLSEFSGHTCRCRLGSASPLLCLRACLVTEPGRRSGRRVLKSNIHLWHGAGESGLPFFVLLECFLSFQGPP